MAVNPFIPINDDIPRNQYTSSGSQTEFAYTFPIFSADELVVIETDSSENDATRTEGVGADQFVITGVNDPNGGLIIFNSSRTDDNRFTLYRDVPLERTTDFAVRGGFTAERVNLELDTIIMILQQLDSKLGRTLIAELEDEDATLVLPRVASRAGKYLAFDANGNLSPTTGTGDTIPISSVMEPFVQAVSLPAALAILGALSNADNAVQTANINANAVTNAKLATMANNTVKGNVSGSTAAPSDLSAAQLVTLTGAITSVVMQKITSSGTYTPTSGMVYALVECFGAGGGGGGNTTSGGGGGGGAGAYSKSLISAASIGASQTATIGAAGTAGAAGGSNGGNGGSTSLGSLVVAGGGLLGTGIASGGGAGGAGGVPSAGNVQGYGAPGNLANGSANGGGQGGSSVYGSGGVSNVGGAGADARGYGAGGAGGGGGNFAGGAGTQGLIIITEFVRA